MSQETLGRLSYHDPSQAPNIGTLGDAELEIFARNREAAALYLWEPYAHNPKLRRRLGRLDIPCLVLWGESDGVVTPAYGRAFADAIPGAAFKMIEKAAHLPHRECPQKLVEYVSEFAAARQLWKDR
jgi:pimeloyl-ACP methyl ester carboxylesterase